ncbi:11212_t:CDS:2 [Entrophospora sp. SA101]|nr:8147_t:CDS:2 [Entrophospora sp. SA101]CAJ0863214.1 11212_t:CDS:2 [Entrophospora sp. SA101]
MSIEATFCGYIEKTQDTLLIFEACRRGVLPRICRRLQEKERKIVKSGSVFVFDERESGIKSTSSSGSDMDSQSERNKERALVGSLTNSYKFKKGGLIKKTMSIMVNGISQHMISYYTKEDVLAGLLKTPSSIPDLAILEIAPEFLQKQNFRVPPMIESTYDQDMDGMSTFGKQNANSSHHGMVTKHGIGGTVSPTRLSKMDYTSTSSSRRIKLESENSNSSGVVDGYRPQSFSTSSSGFPHYTHYAPNNLLTNHSNPHDVSPMMRGDYQQFPSTSSTYSSPTSTSSPTSINQLSLITTTTHHSNANNSHNESSSSPSNNNNINNNEIIYGSTTPTATTTSPTTLTPNNSNNTNGNGNDSNSIHQINTLSQVPFSPSSSTSTAIVSPTSGSSVSPYTSSYPSYYAPLIKTDVYPAVSMSPNNELYDNFMFKQVDNWN